MESKKWGIGAKIWFGLMIAAQWLMFIEYATKPITRYNSNYQRAALIYGIIGLVGTALYLWLAIGKSKAALIIILVIGGINTVSILFQGSVLSALLSLVAPTITFLIARKKVGF